MVCDNALEYLLNVSINIKPFCNKKLILKKRSKEKGTRGLCAREKGWININLASLASTVLAPIFLISYLCTLVSLTHVIEAKNWGIGERV